MSLSIFHTALYLTPLPAQIFALIGDDVAIDCTPSDPVIEVYIMYYPNGVWWWPYMVAKNGTYNLLSVTKEKSGTYTCVGFTPQTQDFYSTESVNLIVLSGTNEFTFSIVYCKILLLAL